MLRAFVAQAYQSERATDLLRTHALERSSSMFHFR